MIKQWWHHFQTRCFDLRGCAVHMPICISGDCAQPCYWPDLQTARGPNLCQSQTLVILSKDLYLEATPQVARQNLLASLPVAFRDCINNKIMRIDTDRNCEIGF